MFKKVFKNYSKRDRNFSAVLLGTIVFVIIINIIQGIIYNAKTSSGSSEYTEGLSGQMQILNPLFVDLNNINRDISSLIYSGLTQYNPNNKSFEPNLATFTINENSTVYTFTMKDDLFWQDGEPITIDDVIFTYRTVIQNPGFQNSLLRQSLEGVNVEITADNQVQFTLSTPNAFFISQTDIGLLPKHIYENIPVNQIGNEIENNQTDLIIGSGPYKLQKIENLDPGITRVSLKQYKDYHNEAAKIKDIIFFIYPTEQELIKNQSSLDTISNINYTLQSQLDQARFKTQEYLLPQYTALFLNTDRPVLQDRTVRVVLKRGANPKEVINNLEDKQPISRPFFQFEAINEITTTDPQVLKELLEDENWELNENNIYQKQDQTLELNLIAQKFSNNEFKNQEYETVVKNLTQTFNKIGIQINANFYESEQFARVLADRNFDIALIGHSLGTDLDSYSFWHSSQATASGLNISNYKNIATDSLLENARKTSDVSERNDLLLKINEKLVYDVPAIFLYTDKHVFAFDNKVKNRKILTSYAFASDRFYDITNWELN